MPSPELYGLVASVDMLNQRCPGNLERQSAFPCCLSNHNNGDNMDDGNHSINRTDLREFVENSHHPDDRRVLERS
eukprot:10640864-Karenia_brevis.AAC.1